MSSFWQETVKTKVLSKNRKSITIPAFAVRCGETNGSLFFTARTSGGSIGSTYTGDAYSLKAAFTIEMWLKTDNIHNTQGTIFGNYRTINADFNIEIAMIDERIGVILRKAGLNSVTSAGLYPRGEWFHLAITYNGTTAKIYINGELDANTLALAANLDTSANNIYGQFFGNNTTGTTPYVGRMTEARIWNIALTKEQIQLAMFTRRGMNNGLKTYYKMNQAIQGSVLVSFDEFITDTLVTFSSSADAGVQFDGDDYPTLIYGASFVAARWTIEGGVKCSFKYPTEKPEDSNFMLAVSFVDEDNNVFRYKLWDQDGVTINPPLERYRGQKLPETFYLEAWNIDGDDDATLAEDLTILISKVTIPTNQRDEESVVLVEEPEIDISLGEPFPFVFPLEWNTSIWGTVDDPETQPVGAYSANLPVYGAIQ